MHDDPFEHTHEDPFGPEDQHALWDVDRITLTSVGIDVGTATSQVVFSRIILQRMSQELSSRFVVVSRELLYLSPVHFTPYTPGRERIDDLALAGLIDAAYKEAGLQPEDVDTGAIILTGEAIRRDNARAIADRISERGGNFVCATAGHNFEAVLAAHGSGAVAISAEQQHRLLNIDIGGGTTKLAVVDRGRVVETAAFHVGGRLIAQDGGGKLSVLEPGGAAIAANLGYDWQAGDAVSGDDINRVADWMAQAVVTIARERELPPELASLFLTPPLAGARRFDGVVFSGGVGEYVYGKEGNSFGDIGAALGAALRRYAIEDALPAPLVEARECIRATVMGASQHTVQISGNTIHRSAEALLPRRNLQVLRPPVDLSGAIEPQHVAQGVAGHFASFDLREGDTDVALAFEWQGEPSAARLGAFCQGLIAGLPETLGRRRPLFLVFDRDVAGLIGSLLREDWELESEVLSIDGIGVGDFDFIDLGKILQPSGTVPVTIKSLVFHL
jgi:ethanolamine utilization protein EutA